MITFRQLRNALDNLADEQLNMTATVSAGCDENGNAEFLPVSGLTLAMNPDVEAAALDVLDPSQPIILFDS